MKAGELGTRLPATAAELHAPHKWGVKDESGQSILLVVLALGFFLLGAIAFGVDIANLWFHRQMAQTAADAACTAGVMDMLYQAQGESSSYTSWIPTTASPAPIDCSGKSDASAKVAPCWYAARNGYGGADYSGGAFSVQLSFPASNSNVSTSASAVAYLPPYITNPLLQVNIRDRTRVFFAALLNGGQTSMDVGAQAVCAVVDAMSPMPLLVLDPHDPTASGQKGAFSNQGSQGGGVTIWGGPTLSIQVNDGDSDAVSMGGSMPVNLAQAGPNNTGGSFGVTGGPADQPGTVLLGTSGSWMPHHARIYDPFAALPAPTKSLPNGLPLPAGSVTHNVQRNGCPSGTTCDEYTPGYYPNGISVANKTAIFDPGPYYLEGDFKADQKSCLRPSNYDPAGYGWGGLMIYISDSVSSSATFNVNSNSGSACTADFNTLSGSGILANGVKCTATSMVPSNLPGTLSGNVLLAPCTGPYGDTLEAVGRADPNGEQRGMLLFQDRSSTSLYAQSGQYSGPSWGGGGSFLLAGTIYFHSCNSSDTAGTTATNCGNAPGDPTNPGPYWSDLFSLQGHSGSSTYVVGNIVVDNLALGGSSSITMDLNPTPGFPILKATLIQ